jgi:aminomethyltransferase
MVDAELRHSPLDAEHRALGARMVEFGGWDMPIQYTGVLEEHRACREGAVVFDVSHLGSVRVSGVGALAMLQWALTNDLGRIAPGRTQYTHLLDPADAHVVDDIIVWWVADGDFLVMPNASNTARIADAFGTDSANTAADGPISMGDITSQRAILAVQGPQARELLAPIVPGAASVGHNEVAAVSFDGAPGYVSGTGYTGGPNPGVELHVPAESAPGVWRRIIEAGIQPAGLGSRDTLRLEAGLPLHGHELGPGITPLQAGLGWVVRWDKGEFRGRAPLLAEKDRGVERLLRGLVVEGRQVPRAKCVVLIDGARVGEITSGNFSPMLGHGIALAFLPPQIADGTLVEIDVRGRLVPAKVTKPPFVPLG